MVHLALCEQNLNYKTGLPFETSNANLRMLLNKALGAPPNGLSSPIRLVRPKIMPGVYGIFFPTQNKIYIGQAKNVSQEISMYRTGQRANQELNQLFKQNSVLPIAFAFYQGTDLEDKKIRLDIEKTLIQKTSSFNLNTVHTPKQALVSAKGVQNKTPIRTELFAGSLKPYGLSYEGLIPPKDQGCVYLFFNPETKNFYIGETSNFYDAKVIKRHRTALAESERRTEANSPIKHDETLAKISTDLKLTNNTLLFTAIEYLDNSSKKERLVVEAGVKQKAAELYPGRMYNKLNFIPNAGIVEQSEESKQRIREAVKDRTVTQDLTEYPCICEGKWFKNRAEASRAYNYKTGDGLKYKLNNPAEKNFIWLKDTKNKPIPPDPLIRQKVEAFFATLQLRPRKIIPPKSA